ncbi:MAG: outer membrane beta-barrel protein [Bacteroidales bacterium]|nr:outer membrane beta-barrel protein [Bacteroidales bacterium]
MKKILVIAFMILGSLTVMAQENELGISFFQNYSTFRFIDSEGEKEDLSFTIKSGYGLSYRKTFSSPLFVEGIVSYNNKGAYSSIDYTRLDWSFHYVNVDMNLGCKFVLGRIKPQIGAGIYYGRLFKADQNIGTMHYDLLEMNTINKNDSGVNVFGGLEYDYSDSGSVLFRISESLGLMQLEKEDTSQEMFNRTFSVQLGLLFNIIKR